MSRELLRYVSVMALIISPDKKSFVVGERSSKDEFKAKRLGFVSGRVEHNELIGRRLFQEIEEEVGIPVEKKKMFLGDCSFYRGEYPVTQLCFAVFATTHELRKSSEELESIYWITPQDFFDRVVGKDQYLAQLALFVETAQDRGLLKK